MMLCIWIQKLKQGQDRDVPEKDTLHTLGDAIASFMRVPDKYTVHMCLATKRVFLKKSEPGLQPRKTNPEPQEANSKPRELIPEPREYKPDPQRWGNAASRKQWAVLFSA
jgi:hypothetical protein